MQVRALVDRIRGVSAAGILVLFALFALVAASDAQAAELEVVAGELVGASEVDVEGTLYDVEFRAGTCAQWFDGCDAVADFPFPDRDEGIEAMRALEEQVLIQAGPLGSFDSDPYATRGCGAGTSSDFCFVITPFDFRDPVGLRFLALINRPDQEADSLLTLGLSAVGPTVDPGEGLTYAVWTPTPVPVPGPGLLLAPALLLVGSWALGARVRSNDQPGRRRSR